MPEIGSAAWIEAFDAAVAGVDPGDLEVTVVHRIAGGPAWRVVVGGGSITVEAATVDGDARTADLRFTWQRADAEAVARGELAPLEAFQAGRLTVGGDLTRLPEVASLFSRFPVVPAGGR
jgi:hypothetical protein